MSIEKYTKVLLINLINKKILLYKMSFYPKQYTRSKGKMNFKLDLSKYATMLT